MYVLYIVVCPFVFFLLAIVLSVLHRYTDSDYPFDIFKLVLHYIFIDELVSFWSTCVLLCFYLFNSNFVILCYFMYINYVCIKCLCSKLTLHYKNKCIVNYVDMNTLLFYFCHFIVLLRFTVSVTSLLFVFIYLYYNTISILDDVRVV